MRRDDGDHAARGQDELPSARLTDGLLRLFPDLRGVAQRERILPQAAADDAVVERLGLREAWRGFAVVPIYDGE